MDIFELIANYKSSLEKTHSKLTVKNYLSDINQFVAWFANTEGEQFQPDLLTKSTISAYQLYLESPTENNQTYAFKSSKRHLSSLRSFTAYLTTEGLIDENPFTLPPAELTVDPWKLKDFKNFLYENSSSDLTIKYYINDIRSFSKWYEESVRSVSVVMPPVLNLDIISEYTRRLEQSLSLSPRSINRKLSSLRRYIQFLKAQHSLDTTIGTPNNINTRPEEVLALHELAVDHEEKPYSKIPPVRLVQKLTKPYFMLEDKAADMISAKIITSRLRKAFSADGAIKPQPVDQMIQGLAGKNIKKEFYAPYSVSTSEFPLHKKIIFNMRHTRPEWYKRYHSYPFVHYMHFGILVLVAAGAGLYLYHNTLGNANATDIQAKNTLQRTFVFKGRLLDKNNQPLKESTDLRLGLYTNPTASGSALAWQEVQNSIKPDENGNITVVIGNKTMIPDSLFESNTPLYLGITVGNEEELSPRQQIGVPYAKSSGDVQGYEPITTSDKQTNVLLALDASGVLSIGGEANPVFTATGGQFTLSGNTVLLTTNAGSGGNVVINPSGNGRIDLQQPIINSMGVISTEGSVQINATTSATPAFSINQDNGGPLLVASAAGSARFIVDSQGTIIKGIWAGSPIGTGFGGFGADITPATPGEILYSTSTTSYGHLRPGTAGQCLITNGYAAPLWSSCGFLSEVNGVLTPTNSTMDIVLGSTATGSARFAFVNMNSGTPSFRVGQGLIISSNSIEGNNQDLNIGGGSTKNVLLASAGGNVGVNTSSPSRNLDVNGSWGGNVDFYSDGAATQTVIRENHALIYDLEKSTGTAEASTTTTYNIVGLPNTDGTFAYLYTKISKGSTTLPHDQTIKIDINGVPIKTISTNNDTFSANLINHYTLIRSNGVWHLLGQGADTDDAADLAEWTVFSGFRPAPGSIVSISSDGTLTKSTLANDTKVAGIVSTRPKITIGLQSSDAIPLALSGRVPVIVTSVNGQIKAGDFVSSSPISGVGMKLSGSGATVGKTLESFNPDSNSCSTAVSLESIKWPDDDGKNSSHPCFKISVASFDPLTRTQLQEYGLTAVDYLYIGKVMALSQLSWSRSDDIIASVQSASVTHEDPASINSLDSSLASAMDALSTTNDVVIVGGRVAKEVEALSALAVGKIKAGSIIAGAIATNTLYAGAARISNLTVSDKLTASQIVSPLISAEKIAVNHISPKNEKNLTVDLPASDSAVIVNNSEGKQVADIDASGNASFSGNLSSAGVNTTDATVSGTIRAKNLVAENIEGLDEKVSSIAAQIAASKPVQNAPLPNLGPTLAQASVSAQFGTFYEGLLSLGASTFGDLSVMDQLSIGTTFVFSQNSINTLGTELAIQPLRQGAVSFLAGEIRIESDGRLTVNQDAVFAKNLSVKGKLLTNVVSPLGNNDLKVTNSSGSAVMSVSQKGDVEASGSGTFAKLNLSLVGQAQASGGFTATASSSAGTAILNANTHELTIYNPQVTDKSLIYISPAQNTNNNVLYLMRQTPNTSDGPVGSFTVGVSQISSENILFNWLIVN